MLGGVIQPSAVTGTGSDAGTRGGGRQNTKVLPINAARRQDARWRAPKYGSAANQGGKAPVSPEMERGSGPGAKFGSDPGLGA
jgi:hypothetical protein